MTNILFFDTETTGLPNFKSPSSDPSQPSVLQLGAILCSSEGNELECWETLVKIGDKPIHPMALAAHNISADKANSEGIDKTEAFNTFYELSRKAESICCHNFNFDIRLLKIMAAQCGVDTGEAENYDMCLSEILDLPYFCTMQSTIKFCALPFPSGRKGNKFPKLSELYYILFDEEFIGAHDALTDVRGTVRCFFELRKRGIL
jgi:DNA polymerase III epsilon subunit-like protein